MKTKSLMVVALIALFIGMGTVANAAITINPVASIDTRGNLATTIVAPNGVFYVVVQASDVTGITGVALTLNYDATNFKVVGSRTGIGCPVGITACFLPPTTTGELNRGADIDSEMFSTFVDTRPGGTQDVIRVANVALNTATTPPTQLGKVMFSGAIINSTTGNSTLTGDRKSVV